MIRPASPVSVQPNGGSLAETSSPMLTDDYHYGEEEEETIVNLDLHRETSSTSVQTNGKQEFKNHINDSFSTTDSSDEHEPLGYQNFLCDVIIEYNPGGNRTHSASDRHSFKLKCLPYMIRRDHEEGGKFRKGSLASSSNSICDQTSHQNQSPSSSSSSPTTVSTTIANTTSMNLQEYEPILELSTALNREIDVTKATCAFLGNSDYVPTKKFGRRRVVLELISAKLSQSTTYNVPSNTSLVSLPEQPQRIQFYNVGPTNASFMQSTGLQSSGYFGNSERTSVTESTMLNNSGSNQSNHPPHSPAMSPSAASTSKRFVNYTILIKMAPGLDNHPAVIERRFSDFLNLYQGLKCHEPFAKIVDKYVTFPKKVYMGNFSLTNIAERSIEFSRLLSLCMNNVNIMWSVPFISFLLDKELKEAHKLSLCGDPDDVQALIETAYYIEQKLYLNKTQQQWRLSNNNSPSVSLEVYNNGCCSPILPNDHPQEVNSSSNETISADSSYFNTNRPTSTDPGTSSSQNQSICDTNKDLDSLTQTKATPSSLNQRILVTFCMLFLTYYRGENYQELKLTLQEFISLISSQEYVESMINTRHYMTLRACLLFLMNMNKGDVIDERHRLWLKQRLEDIDGAHADLNESFTMSTRTTTTDTDSSYMNSPKSMKRSDDNETSINGNSNVHRITKGDLTSLLRNRNFCSFQDGKFTG